MGRRGQIQEMKVKCKGVGNRSDKGVEREQVPGRDQGFQLS